MRIEYWQAPIAEALGTAMLLATVVGSGIMAVSLADGNVALALLANAIATGAILVVLIMVLAPISGAHFNPAVSVVFMLRKELSKRRFIEYILAQIAGAVLGVIAAHTMFEMPLVSQFVSERVGYGQFVSEILATFGLVFTILGTLRYGTAAVASCVGLYISAAYWFTASTSFANPAVTIARSLTQTFSGIRFEDVPLFLLAQIMGAIFALFLFNFLRTDRDSRQ